jgi:hypothetical protein
MELILPYVNYINTIDQDIVYKLIGLNIAQLKINQLKNLISILF